MEPFDFVNRANADYIDQLHEKYQKDPRAVPEQWRAFFAGFELGSAKSEKPGLPSAPIEGGAPPGSLAGEAEGTIPLNMGVFDLVHTYREIGHFVAKLDPLGHDRPNHPLLELSNFGMAPADLDREVGAGSFLGPTNGTLRDLIEKLRDTYCRTIGVEYTGIADKAQRQWLQQRMEPILNRPQLTPAEQKNLLHQLMEAEEFEQFLHSRYIGAKRFSLEGAEALIPMVNTLVEEGATILGEQFIMAMAHRGRLNTLAHVLNKPYEVMLSEFEGTLAPVPGDEGDGDVKYHMGYANERALPSGKVKVSLLPNPSHLELIDPIEQGIVRAKQRIFGDKGRSRVVPICMHGDAAFTGQGIVAETLNLSELSGYRTGGTIHIIINNQIGFTTPPTQERFTPYPTDLAKSIQAPIIHVNGDDPEAVVWASKLAIGFRQEFKVDVMLDLWCYRRHGHNEGDEPSYTQPVMYREIKSHPSVVAVYSERLLAEGRITQAEIDEMRKEIFGRLESAQRLAKEVKPRQKIPSFGGVWRGLGKAPANTADWTSKTNVTKDQVSKVADTLRKIPANFTVHPKLKRIVVDDRIQMFEGKKPLDYGAGEMLAMGSLLLEGTPVRFTGQDVERGTFSHRHAVLHDYENGNRYTPLQHVDPKQPTFTIMNSMLSEFAVLGFEWGYASADPRNLVIWEAQFGDFVNGAQPIIDQILASAESKWRYMNGMVMNLPHGFEGQGPEHSNAYLERFLALCAENNMQVCVPTTSAQYFHMLRRQIHRKFRKPLVLMMPKSLLRAESATSPLSEFLEGTTQLVIDDAQAIDRDRVRRVLLCTGKVYYTLAAARAKANKNDTAIIRVEQLYPFPQKELTSILAKYPRKEEVCWVQEEPKNRGAWTFMEPRLLNLLPDNVILAYHGRDESASPAVGSKKNHDKEEEELIAHALELSPKAKPVKEATAPGTPASVKAQTAVSD